MFKRRKHTVSSPYLKSGRRERREREIERESVCVREARKGGKGRRERGRRRELE
jgi:hypothetical protein